MLNEGLEKLARGLYRYVIGGVAYYIRHKFTKNGYVYEVSTQTNLITECELWRDAINIIKIYHSKKEG